MENEELESTIKLVVPIIFAIITIIGVIGNISVLVISFKYRNMKTLNNTMVVALAIADLCFLVVCVPFTAVQYSTSYPFGNIWCKISQFINFASAYASIYFLCLMSLDRFAAIVYPLKSKKFRTKKMIYVSLGCIVVFSLALSSPILVTSGLVVYKTQILCTFSLPKYEILKKVFETCFFIVSYCIPVLLIAVINTWMFMSIRKYRKRHRQLTNNTRTQNQHMKAAVVVLAAEIGFIICWTPIQFLLIMLEYRRLVLTYKQLRIFNVAANVMSYSSSCLNPILYTFVSKEYRSKIKGMFRFNCYRMTRKSRQYRPSVSTIEQSL